MRPARAIAFSLLAVALSGCGKDPFAGKLKPPGERPTGPEIATEAEKFDPGLVAAYEELVKARRERNLTRWTGGFAGEAGSGAAELWDESTTARVVAIRHKYTKEEISGDRATLVVVERIEERDPKDPKSEVHAQEVTVTATLVRAGGAWKALALRADWR
jgi:hypothetical protein